MTTPREGDDFTIDVTDGGHQPDPDWADKLLCGRNGIKPVLANAALALRSSPEWFGALAFNEFSLDPMLMKPAPWDAPGGFRPRPWTEQDKLLVTEWLNQHGVDVFESVAHQAAMMVGREASFHPVRQYLAGLQWDRKPRVDSWLTDYLGVEASPYVSAAGRCFLVSCIARVMRPGAKVDTALILEGRQGAGKSTALKVLGGEWFTDEIADFGSKDATMQMRGVWLIELSELDALGRKEVAEIKAFISRTNDRFRPPFERYIVNVPRQCVFAGTTNAETYLRDETGARRFWPVKVTRPDTKKLAADRDQLFAEALELFRAGWPWWFNNDALVKAAATEQAARYVDDPWTEKVQAYTKGLKDVAIPDILYNCLFIIASQWTQVEMNRVARILTADGWSRKQFWNKGNRAWRYVPPPSSPVQSGDAR